MSSSVSINDAVTVIKALWSLGVVIVPLILALL